MIGKDGLDQERQEGMEEVLTVKDCLAREGLNVKLDTIRNALIMPEEPSRIPGQFVYPSLKVGLLQNPWPKVAKKKKGKKGKK